MAQSLRAQPLHCFLWIAVIGNGLLILDARLARRETYVGLVPPRGIQGLLSLITFIHVDPGKLNLVLYASYKATNNYSSNVKVPAYRY